jgi:S-DNA-T family DNA segregation ATPase FtsK/SpoIIIE
MARTRTIRRSSSRVRRKSQKRFLGFLPEGLQAFIARRLVDIFAAALCLSGVFVLFALLSYDHQDPSWNSASTAELNEMPVRNWMGHNGAWTADLFLQTVGIGGFLYGIILLVWGVRSFLRQPLSPLWLRIIALAFAGVCCSVAFAQIPSNGWTPYPYMGSSVGKLFMDTLGNWGNAISPWMGPVTISVIAAILTLATALYAGATQLAEIGYVTDKAYNFLRYTCLFALALGQGFTNWLRHHNDPDYRPDPASLFSFLHREEEDTYERAPRPVRKQPRVSEDDSEEDEEDEDEEDFAAARMPAAARPAARAGAIPVVKAPSCQDSSARQCPATLQPLRISGRLGVPAAQPARKPARAGPEHPAQRERPAEECRAAPERADGLQHRGRHRLDPSPVVTLYELEPAPGIKSSRVIGLADDIARSMSASPRASPSCPAATPSASNCRTRRARRSICASCWSPDFEKSKPSCRWRSARPSAASRDRRPRAHAAPADRRHHRLGQVGRHQHHDPVAALPAAARAVPADHDRSEDARTVRLRRHPAPAAPVVTDPKKAVVALKWAVREMEDRYRRCRSSACATSTASTKRAGAPAKGEIISARCRPASTKETGERSTRTRRWNLEPCPTSSSSSTRWPT